jgi:hypothetical protein
MGRVVHAKPAMQSALHALAPIEILLPGAS